MEAKNKTCLACGKTYQYSSHAGHKAWSRRKFCSMECSLAFARKTSAMGKQGKSHPSYIEIKYGICQYCGKEITGGKKRKPSRDSKKRFCNRVCWGMGRRAPRNHNGYLYVQVGAHKRRPIHALMVEKVLGRKLKKGEVVHHVDTLPSHNENKNFVVCTTGYHRQIHERMARLYARDHFGEGSWSPSIEGMSC